MRKVIEFYIQSLGIWISKNLPLGNVEYITVRFCNDAANKEVLYINLAIARIDDTRVIHCSGLIVYLQLDDVNSNVGKNGIGKPSFSKHLETPLKSLLEI